MISLLRTSRILIFVAALALLALGLATTQTSGPRVVSADTGDAQPQGVAPNPGYLWNAGSCPDMVDTFDQQPELRPGDCTGANWNTSAASTLFTLDDVYDQFLLVGDWNKDACSDLMATQAGTMWLLPGDCNSNVASAVQLPGDFSEYNYFVAVGDFDGDSQPDLLARKSSDSSLWFLKGAPTGFDGDPVLLGTNFSACDAILGAGDFDGDGHADMLCRQTADHSLLLFAGNGQGSMAQGVPVVGGADLGSFDWLMAGGDWVYGDNQGCPDIVGWKQSEPGNLSFYAGDCHGAINLPGTVVAPTTGGFTYPFGSDSAKVFFWGEADCNGELTPRDGQALLKFVLAQPPLSQMQPCYSVGSVVFIVSDARLWGDWDCDGSIGPRDAQDVQKVILGNPPLSAGEDCPAFMLPVGPNPD